jgi:hypothetical protein
MSTRLSAIFLCSALATTAYASAAEAKSQPFNRRAEVVCEPNKSFCKGSIDIPKAEGTVISFVTCFLGYSGEVHAQFNITRAAEESGFFTLMTPTGGNFVKVISQTTSIYIPPSSGVAIVFDILGGQMLQTPSCVVSGHHD